MEKFLAPSLLAGNHADLKSSMREVENDNVLICPVKGQFGRAFDERNIKDV